MKTSKKYYIEDYMIKENAKIELKETMHEFDFLYIDLNKILDKEDIESWNKFTSTIPEECIYRDKSIDCNDYGIETNKHISILYGILPYNSARNIEMIKALVPFSTIINLSFKGISYFNNEDKPYEVLKFDIEAKGLNYYYNILSQEFDITDSSMAKINGFKPHATIAYLNKNTFCNSPSGGHFFFEYQLNCPFLHKEFKVSELEYQDTLGNITTIYL